MTFRLEIQPAPPARPHKPTRDTRDLEDGWNRYAAAAFELEERRAELEALGRERTSEAAHLAVGYERGAAAREAIGDAVAFQAARRAANALAPASASETLSAWKAAGHRPPAVVVDALTQRAKDADAGRLAAIILTTRKSAKRCRRDWVLVGCKCGAHLRHTGCSRVDCLNCAPDVTARRARSIYGKVSAALELARRPGAPDPRLYSLRVSVLTMPVELRDRYSTAAAWRKLRLETQRLFRTRFGAAWCVVATHPVGDEAPEVFHPHLNVLWGFTGPRPGFMPPAELAALKRAWKKLVYRSWYVSTYRLFEPMTARARAMWRARLGALRLAGLAPRVARRRTTLDVWGQYVPRTETKKLRHRARYYGRVFVGWKLWLPKAVQWYGALPRSLPDFCDRCGVEWRSKGGRVQCEACGKELEGTTRPRAACPTCREEGRVPWFRILRVGGAARRTFEHWRELAAAGPAPPS